MLLLFADGTDYRSECGGPVFCSNQGLVTKNRALHSELDPNTYSYLKSLDDKTCPRSRLRVADPLLHGLQRTVSKLHFLSCLMTRANEDLSASCPPPTTTASSPRRSPRTRAGAHAPASDQIDQMSVPSSATGSPNATQADAVSPPSEEQRLDPPPLFPDGFFTHISRQINSDSEVSFRD
jgi:hypothetical protein